MALRELGGHHRSGGAQTLTEASSARRDKTAFFGYLFQKKCVDNAHSCRADVVAEYKYKKRKENER